MMPEDRYDVSSWPEAQFEPGSDGQVLQNCLGIASKSDMDTIEAKALEQAGEAAWKDCKEKKGLIDTTQFQTEEAPDNTIVYAIAGIGLVGVLAGAVVLIRRRRASAAAAAAVKV